ncbi:DUF6882 domain-containing protein [Dactylosporangium sp. NPDC006015]|uniref:DUF6882 domain-containing protein n=1 Tax=Dactylosporangium sp. NPDC006015 TaxID=3154576 RepID=UPI0033A3D479
MGIFNRRRAGTDDVALLALQGEDMIEQLAQAHVTWGLGTADRWGLDQRTGVITWTFPDKTASAPAQILGSFNASTSSWVWAWGNGSILPELSVAAAQVRDWGAERGLPAFTQARVDVDEEGAATLVAVAVRVTKATGFYRASGTASVPVITFGPVTLTAADGTTSTFTVDVS